MSDEVNDGIEDAGPGADAGIDGKGKGGSGELQAQLDAQTTLAQRLMTQLNDPDVAAVVQAKAEKKSLRIAVGDVAVADPNAPEPLPSAADIDEMTPSQLMALVAKQIRSSVAEAVTGEVAPLRAAESERRKEKLTAEATELVERYPDFVDYGEAIKDLAGKGLTLEQAYISARIGAGKGLPTPVVKEAPVSSERPTSVEVRKEIRDAPGRLGVRGFRQDLAEVANDVVDKVISEARRRGQ
jgi:hypothetical protein